jgi:hypothetical protein
MAKVVFIAVVIFGFIALWAVVGLFIAFPVMWLWNWIMPTLFRFSHITYWQAYGLYLLCAILFKSSSSSRANK